jgi:hypothetical protein
MRQAVVTLFIVTGMVLGNGCGQKETPAVVQPSKPAEMSAEKNSFREVTSKLDAGGNLYVYLSTEEWLEGLSQKVAGWRGLTDSFPDMKAQDKQNVGKVFDVVTSLIQKSGVEDVSGVGMSSIQHEKGVYHSKFVIHHYPGKGSGFLWTMFGKSSHPLKGLEMLPASTVVATFSDMDLGMLWSAVEEQVGNVGIPEVKEQMQKLPDQFAGATGLQWDKVLASLGNEYGLVITLDETKKMSLPIGASPVDVPEPGIMLVIKVKDDTIFNRVDEVLKDNKQVIKSDKDGVKMRTMPVPIFSLRPTVARSGDYLFIASSDALIQEALDVKGGKKPGLKTVDEFKRLAKGMPEQGNQFTFVSQRFTKTVQDVQTQIMSGQANVPAGQADLMKKLMSLNEPAYSYSVSANTDEGWVGTGNGNQNPAKIVLLPVVAIPAVAAGVALPAIAKAKEKAARMNAGSSN